MKHFLVPILEKLRGENAGFILGLVFFLLALFWVLFGLIKMLFIVGMTLLGYGIGFVYFRDSEKLKELIDKLLPPGRFR